MILVIFQRESNLVSKTQKAIVRTKERVFAMYKVKDEEHIKSYTAVCLYQAAIASFWKKNNGIVENI